MIFSQNDQTPVDEPEFENRINILDPDEVQDLRELLEVLNTAHDEGYDLQESKIKISYNYVYGQKVIDIN
jgi:hypothetical protein